MLFVAMVLLTGCSNENKLTIENKISSEIEYVEKHCGIFINNFDNGEYIRDGILNSEKIDLDINTFIDSLSVVIEDLRFVKLNEDIINNIEIVIQNIRENTKNKQYDKVKNEYINLYNWFKTLKT